MFVAKFFFQTDIFLYSLLHNYGHKQEDDWPEMLPP